jgi:hypothetical protein
MTRSGHLRNAPIGKNYIKLLVSRGFSTTLNGATTKKKNPRSPAADLLVNQ